MKILNCVRDLRYTNGMVRCMNYTGEKSGVDNKFVVIGKKQSSILRYIENIDSIEFVKEEDFLNYLIENNIEVVILHAFNSCPYNLIPHIPIRIKVVWVAWGYDIYSLISYRPFIPLRHIYGPLTLKAKSGNAKETFQQAHAKLHAFIHHKEIEKAVSRIDYFSGVVESEYDLMRKNSFFQAKKVIYNYFDLNTEMRKNAPQNLHVKGNNIIIGNSADPTNNHLDAFERVKNVDLHGKKIYSFLSYGGTEEYKNKVIKKGKELWGERFFPITDFLPFNDYMDIVRSCGNVIMFHERQQAMGNITTALWTGCKVFLSKSSILYHSMKDHCILYNMDDDLSEQQFSTNLRDKQICKNRQFILQNYSLEANLLKIYKFYEVLKA